MKNSNRDNRSSGAGGGRKFRGTDSGKFSFGNRADSRSFGDRDSGRSSRMHRATCSDCGKECELPFKPTGDKPVFCSDCFGNKVNSNRSTGRDPKKSNFQEKRMYSALCTECGSKCEVPFRPTGGKPIYCSNCFRKGDSTGGKNTEQFKEQFGILNAKLDTILNRLTPVIPSEVVPEQRVAKKKGVSKSAKQQATRTVSSQKTVKKTVDKKATKKSGVTKPAKRQTKKTVSPKKTVKKKAAKKKKN